MLTTSEAPAFRPLGIGQLIDRSIRLYRANFATFVGIIAIMLVPISLLMLVVQIMNVPAALEATQQLQRVSNNNPFLTFMQAMSASSAGGSTFVFSILNAVLVNGVAVSALVRAGASANLSKPLTIGEAYSSIKSIWLKVVLAYLLIAIILIGLFVWFLIPCVGWATGFGILMFFSYVVSPLVPIVIVLEGQDIGKSVLRAWELTRRRFWWALGFMIILGIFAYIIIAGPTFLITFLVQATIPNIVSDGSPATILTIQTITQAVTTLLLSMLYLPLQYTAVMMLYFDLRIRTEGLDLAIQAAMGEGGPTDPTRVLSQNIPPNATNLVTMREMLYFAGISAAVLALYLLLVGIVFLIAFGAVGLNGAR